MTHQDDSRMLRIPSPHDPNSGYQTPGYAIAHAPPPAPEGKVFVPAMNTYVDSDIAAQLGFVSPQGASGAPDVQSLSMQSEGIPNELSESFEGAFEGMSDAELEALQDEIEQRAQEAPSLSPALDAIADCFGTGFDAAVTRMVNGTPEETLATFTQATGVDDRTAASLIETTVMEAEPTAAEYIGSNRWKALVYAAAATPDPYAKRVVSDFVRGKLPPSKLMSAYTMWWNNLPDAEEA